MTASPISRMGTSVGMAGGSLADLNYWRLTLSNAAHAALCVACQGVRSHAVPVAGKLQLGDVTCLRWWKPCSVSADRGRRISGRRERVVPLSRRLHRREPAKRVESSDLALWRSCG